MFTRNFCSTKKAKNQPCFNEDYAKKMKINCFTKILQNKKKRNR